MPPKTIFNAVKSYALATLCVVLTTLVRFSLNPILGRKAAFIVYFPALVLSAWIGGWVGGLLALVLSTLAATYFFITPTHSLLITNSADQITLLVFVIVGLSVSAISSSQQRVRQAAEKSAAEAIENERALRESEARKTAILEAALDCIITIDNTGRIVEFNPAAERTFGYTASEAIGQPIAETVIPASLRQQHYTGFAHYLATGEGPVLGKRIELIGLRKNGEEFPLELAIVPMGADHNRGFTAYLRDLSTRKLLEAEQNSLSDTNRLLLESTNDGIYGIDLQGQFTFVNRAAAQMLGFPRDSMVGRNGHRLIHHTYPEGAAYPENECPIYQALRSGESAHVEDDVFWRNDGTCFPVAYSAAPILDYGTVRGAVVTFSDISERKALEQQRDRLAEREHRIAEQLQAALQPPTPKWVPGLVLADYYRPAWDEAGVGGDFSDVFSDDKDMTFLVVGDLSGKGLAAASEVATVRQMLRFALLNGRSIAGPVTALNRTLAEHNLLTGFATLFVGRYDAGTRTLTYVNCGQDAGLVLRAATGRVETLPPTGPVLGAITAASYTEAEIRLADGDVLAVYTDGLTEAGPTRTTLLTGEGVADLLRGLSGITDPHEIVRHLMAGVDAHAGAGVRDDQCLLVGLAWGAGRIKE